MTAVDLSPKRASGQPAGLVGVLEPGDGAALDGGVGGDDSVDVVAHERTSDARDVAGREVGRDLHHQRRVFSMDLREARLLGLERGSSRSNAASSCSSRRPFVFGDDTLTVT